MLTRAKIREGMKLFHQHNPEIAIRQSERMKSWHLQHPEFAIQQSERMKLWYQQNPDYKVESSKRMKLWHEQNPDFAENMRLKAQDPETKARQSEAKKLWYKQNPEFLIQQSERITLKFQDPKERAKHSESIKQAYAANPELTKERHERILKLGVELVESHKSKRLEDIKNETVTPGFACYVSKDCGYTSPFLSRIKVHHGRMHSEYSYDAEKVRFVNEKFQIVDGSMTCNLCQTRNGSLALVNMQYHFKAHHKGVEFDRSKVTFNLTPTGEEMQWEDELEEAAEAE